MHLRQPPHSPPQLFEAIFLKNYPEIKTNMEIINLNTFVTRIHSHEA
jgi:hypothetical protein